MAASDYHMFGPLKEALPGEKIAGLYDVQGRFLTLKNGVLVLINNTRGVCHSLFYWN